MGAVLLMLLKPECPSDFCKLETRAVTILSSPDAPSDAQKARWPLQEARDNEKQCSPISFVFQHRSS